jgi:hypothetical protein
MYHCGALDAEIDPNNLTNAQLHRIAEMGRALESIPFDPRAHRQRMLIFKWAFDSPQVTLTVCPDVIGFFTWKDYEHAQLLGQQLVVSLVAGVVELSNRPEDRVRVNTRAVQGVLELYQAILTERGRGSAYAPLEELRRRQDRGELERYVAKLVGDCR